MTITITTSPTNTHRHETYVVKNPPITGPDRDSHRARRRDQPVGGGRPIPEVDATSATIAGMISAAPMPSNPDQPMISTARLGDGAVAIDPLPYTTQPIVNARFCPRISPTFRRLS